MSQLIAIFQKENPPNEMINFEIVFFKDLNKYSNRKLILFDKNQ